MKKQYLAPETEEHCFKLERNIMSPYSSNSENLTIVNMMDEDDFWY